MNHFDSNQNILSLDKHGNNCMQSQRSPIYCLLLSWHDRCAWQTHATTAVFVHFESKIQQLINILPIIEILLDLHNYNMLLDMLDSFSFLSSNCSPATVECCQDKSVNVFVLWLLDHEMLLHLRAQHTQLGIIVKVCKLCFTLLIEG